MATNALELIGRFPHARPVWEYDEAVGQDICERLIEGESLKAICSDPDMPSRTVVYGWLQEHSAFANNYARARRLQADTFADEIQEVAKNLAILPEHKRVMIDAMKWRAARQNWRAWGDKITHEIDDHRDTAASEKRLPESLEWLAGQLPGSGPAGGRGPDHSDVGEE
jgi:hypothetical protein